MAHLITTPSAELPPIGSQESAVRTAVNLIAGMAGQPEVLVERWLDLYYQVRLSYEHRDSPTEYVGEHTPPEGTPAGKPPAYRRGSYKAADFKRETRERLLQARARGVSMAKIVETANGAIKDDQLLDILEARVAPVNVYKVLAAALDKIEETEGDS